MTDAARRYVLSAAIALVAMAGRIGWLVQPGPGQAPSPGYIICVAAVGTAAALVVLTGVPIALAFTVAELPRALFARSTKEHRP